MAREGDRKRGGAGGLRFRGGASAAEGQAWAFGIRASGVVGLSPLPAALCSIVPVPVVAHPAGLILSCLALQPAACARETSGSFLGRSRLP